MPCVSWGLETPKSEVASFPDWTKKTSDFIRDKANKELKAGAVMVGYWHRFSERDKTYNVDYHVIAFTTFPDPEDVTMYRSCIPHDVEVSWLLPK